eukprot:12777782-Alexandrium_andersonii.AAC.1
MSTTSPARGPLRRHGAENKNTDPVCGTSANKRTGPCVPRGLRARWCEHCRIGRRVAVVVAALSVLGAA